MRAARGLGGLRIASRRPVVGSAGPAVSAPTWVIVNAGEPQNPLIPTNTNDSNGGRIIDRLFAGLMSYDDKGTPALEVARSIETTDDRQLSDHSQARLDVQRRLSGDGALVRRRLELRCAGTNAQLQQSFFSPIAGFDEVAAAKPTATTMSGLQVVSDHEFTVRLKGPTIDFKLRLGFFAVLSTTRRRAEGYGGVRPAPDR